LAQRLSGERVKELIESVNGATALNQLHSAGNMAVRAGNDNTTLRSIETELLVGCELRLGNAHIGDVIGVQVVVVVAQNLGDGVHVDGVLGAGVDDRESEELGVRVVALEEGHIGDVRAAIHGKERALLLQVGGKIGNGLAGLGLVAGENEDAEGSVGRNFLFKLDEVGICETSDGGRRKGTAGSQVDTGNLEQRGLGGMARIPGENVGLVSHSISAGEFTRRLESLDELVLFASSANSGMASRTNLTSRRAALGEQGCVLGIEVEQGLGNILALTLVCAEDGTIGKPALHGMELPGHVECVVESSVHTLASLRLWDC
jgi:hypothetical protein